jgi:hypothetical protein
MDGVDTKQPYSVTVSFVVDARSDAEAAREVDQILGSHAIEAGGGRDIIVCCAPLVADPH